MLLLPWHDYTAKCIWSSLKDLKGVTTNKVTKKKTWNWKKLCYDN